MAVCAGIKRDGGRCTAVVGPSQTHCYQHDPDRAAERRRNASRAARSRPGRDLSEIKALLRDLTDKVIGLRMASGVAAVANQLLNTSLRAIEMERKIKETEELEARVEALEEKNRGKGGGRRWGGA